MKRKLTISYEWTNSDNDNGEVLKHHVEALEESALGRIGNQMKKGCTCGDLHDTISTEKDPQQHEGTNYRGWWEVSKA